VLRRLLAREGVEANSPRAVLQQGYRLGWLDDEDRNLTLHTYREGLALAIYHRVPQHHAVLRAAFEKLRPQLGI
jgi:hypothetical protein